MELKTKVSDSEHWSVIPLPPAGPHGIGFQRRRKGKYCAERNPFITAIHIGLAFHRIEYGVVKKSAVAGDKWGKKLGTQPSAPVLILGTAF
jgi:hypothetical protein